MPSIGYNLLNCNSKIKAKSIDKLNHIQKAHFLNLTNKPNSISQPDLQQIIIKINLKTLAILIDNILVLVFFNVPLDMFWTHQLGQIFISQQYLVENDRVVFLRVRGQEIVMAVDNVGLLKLIFSIHSNSFFRIINPKISWKVWNSIYFGLYC